MSKKFQKARINLSRNFREDLSSKDLLIN